MRKLGILVLFLINTVTHCFAEEMSTTGTVFTLPPDIRLASRAPEKYVINARDSLSSIVSRFVLDVDKVLSAWGANIPSYRAGDIVSLLSQDGQQNALQFKHGRTVKLSPNARVLPQDRKKNILPIDKIQQFLNRPQIITEDELQKSGYILGGLNETLLLTNGMQFYARKLDEMNERSFIIIRPGETYRDPKTGDILAREAIYLGDAELQAEGDPATLMVSHATLEIRKGDRLIPLGERHFNQDFDLHSPQYLDDAYIIGIPNAIARIAQYQIVVINKGTDDNIEVGHFLKVKRRGGQRRDEQQDNEQITLPNSYAGDVLIFKTFERVSYGVVLKAVQTIGLQDEVTVP